MLIKKKNLISKGIISRAHLIVLLMMLMSSFVSCAKLTNDDGGEKIDKTGIKVIEGRVVDGPISGATVYLDINKNGEMDNNEPKQLSDGDGYFRFEADVPTGTVVISQGGVDTVTGEAVEELIGETLGGEFVYISPLTTVLQGVKASKDKTREENRKELLEALGIDFSESEVFTKNTYEMATKEGSESEEDERKKAEKVEKLGMQLTLMIKTAQMVAEIDAGEVSQKEVVKALLGALIEEKKSTKDMQLENKELVKNVLKKVKETVDEKAGMSNPSNNDSKINTIAEGVANGNGALNLSNFKEISEKSSETKKIINDAFQLDQQVKEFLGGTITKEKFEEDIKILIVGCMNSLACNYNEQASIDSGSCEIPVGCNSCSGERDGTGVIVNNDADNDGVCDANDVCDSYANSDATALPTWYEDEDGDGYYSNSSEVCESPGINWNLTAISGNDVCPIDSSITTVTPTWYEDSDGDGLGNGNVSESSCTKPSGYVSNADDSDDECTSNGYQNWYVDSDEDGYGAGSADSVCTDTDSVSGKVTNNNDACPIDSSITTVMPTWYEDLDGDGFGNGDVSKSTCTIPSGYVSNADDSDDVCSSDAYQNWYVDSDGDGYGAGSAESVCIDTVTLDGKVTNNSDACDTYANGDATELPTWYEDEDGDGYSSNSSEVCESPGINWNLTANSGNDACPIDSSITTVTPTWYEDSDGDGLGNGNVSESICTKPSGYVSNADDSDDVCSSDAYQNWYVDSDEDGYGAGSADSICTDTDSVSGKVTNNNDACPIDSSITTVKPTWYEDSDGDGLGNGDVSESSCTQPIGYVSNTDDSDDACTNNSYQNWYVDSDEDGYGTGSATSVCTDTNSVAGKVTNNSDACDSYANSDATSLPTWYEDEDGDGYYSNSSEVCEAPGINWNLTAISGNDACPIDSGITTVTPTWYEDSDGDGLGNGNVSESICTQPSGYVSNTDDSDDACTNNSYQNWYVDSDEDGYGTGSATSVCTDTDSVAGKVTNNSDACDSYANGDASALPTWYEDADGDGYYSTTSVGCESPGSAWRLLVKPGNRAELVAKLNETVPDESNTYYNGNSAATCGDINTWDTSLITNMSFLFQHKSSFNCDISNWDVSNVTNMSHMFRDNYGTSIPIGSWDVSNVVHMTMMFAYSRFNHDISNWNTSKVVQMQGMFQGNTVFNQPLNDWDVSNVTNMCWMFAFNSSFNQPLNDWDVSNVDLMCHMFQEASAFNQPLNNWDVSNVTQIQNIFAWSYAYDQDLSSWDTSKIRSGYFGGFGDQAGFSSTNKCKIHDAFKSNPAWLEDSSQNPWCN